MNKHLNNIIHKIQSIDHMKYDLLKQVKLNILILKQLIWLYQMHIYKNYLQRFSTLFIKKSNK
jgi:hypothetical protein